MFKFQQTISDKSFIHPQKARKCTSHEEKLLNDDRTHQTKEKKGTYFME
jgi:hypothetical protein